MFVSQQGLSATRLCKMFPDRQWNVDVVITLINKTDTTDSIDRQRGVVVHAVRVCLPTSMKLRVSHSAKEINHRHTIARCIVISLGSVNAITKNDLQLMCLRKRKMPLLTGANKRER